MIKDMEEESKTKFSMGVEFIFSFKSITKNEKKLLTFLKWYSIVSIVPVVGTDKCDSGSVGRVRPCQGRGRGFEPRLSL